MKKVKRIVFEHNDGEKTVWTPKSGREKEVAEHLCEALQHMAKYGGVNSIILGILARRENRSSICAVGSQKKLFMLVGGLLDILGEIREDEADEE